jgi:hypothetical protein
MKMWGLNESCVVCGRSLQRTASYSVISTTHPVTTLDEAREVLLEICDFVRVWCRFGNSCYAKYCVG